MDRGLEPNDKTSELLESIQVYEPKEQEAWKDDVYILVLGHTGVGKSSLINALFGREEAEVTDSVTSTQHEPVECHQLVINGKRIYIYDTRGFGDREIEEDDILEKIENKQSFFDLVLFCHKLYDKVDKSTKEEMQFLAREVGNKLLEHTIFVFTFGDEYKIRCTEYKKRRQIPDAQERIQRKMKEKAEELTNELRKSLATDTTDASVINNIPYCIVSGEQTNLPTADNWTNDLWDLIEKRSIEKAQPLMSWYRRNRKKLILASGTGGAIVVGLAAGAALGAVGGTGLFPVLGTAVGGVVGGVGDAVVGGVVGGVTGGVAGGIAGEGGVKATAQKIADKMNDKFSKPKKQLDHVDEGKHPG